MKPKKKNKKRLDFQTLLSRLNEIDFPPEVVIGPQFNKFLKGKGVLLTTKSADRDIIMIVERYAPWRDAIQHLLATRDGRE